MFALVYLQSETERENLSLVATGVTRSCTLKRGGTELVNGEGFIHE